MLSARLETEEIVALLDKQVPPALESRCPSNSSRSLGLGRMECGSIAVVSFDCPVDVDSRGEAILDLELGWKCFTCRGA